MRLAKLPHLLLVIAGVCLATLAYAQTPAEKHDWILLIDASASLTDGGADDVRNEALVQLQTLLAIATERNPAKNRQDRLTAYRFGDGWERISLPPDVLKWDDVKRDVRWDANITARIKRRSDFIAALEQAKRDFQSRDSAQRHIILISDGDLDVNPTNRQAGAPPAKEEEAAYERFLMDRNGLLSWFIEQRVTIDTLYVPRLSRRQPTLLQQDVIRQRLNACMGGDPAEKAFSLIQSIIRRQPCASGVDNSKAPTFCIPSPTAPVRSPIRWIRRTSSRCCGNRLCRIYAMTSEYRPVHVSCTCLADAPRRPS
jgi:hypothetical protein